MIITLPLKKEIETQKVLKKAISVNRALMKLNLYINDKIYYSKKENKINRITDILRRDDGIIMDEYFELQREIYR